MGILKNTTTVEFDTQNVEHLQACEMMLFGKGQHPTIRFKVEPPYIDVRSMLLAKCAEAHIKTVVAASRRLRLVA